MNFLKIFGTLTLGGSALGLLLLLGKKVLFKKLPNTFYYYAWLAVLLRFLVPLPGVIPVKTAAPKPVAAPVTESVELQKTYPAATEAAAVSSPPEAQTTASAEAPVKQPISWVRVVRTVWLVGAIGALGWYLASYGYFVFRAKRSVCRELKWEDAGLSQELWQKPRLLLAENLDSPMLIGVLRPRILLPVREYDRETLQNILRHELVHFHRKDIFYKWFSVLVFSIQWFNPLTYVFRRELNRACELSCDEWVIRHMSAGEKQAYGETLISMASEKRFPDAAGATTFATEKRDLKQRLLAIMGYRKSGPAIALGGLAVAALVFLGLLLGPGSGKFPEARFRGAAGMDRLQVVTVENVEQFLAAIGPNREIRLRRGTYDLLRALDYGGETESQFYSWEPVFDGYQLVIQNVQNLSIRGQDGEETFLLAAPRYADVLHFRNSYNLWLQDLTVGHSPQQGTCTGGVLYFENCRQVDGTGLKLFGCGTIAVATRDVQDIAIRDSDLYDCSYGAVYLTDTQNMQLENSHIYDIDCVDSLLIAQNSSDVQITGCHIENCKAPTLLYTEGGVTFSGNVVENCTFEVAVMQNQKPITVDQCSFRGITAPQWDYPGSVSTGTVPEGVTVQQDVEPETAETTETVETQPWGAGTPEEPREVTVTNVEELLDAIGDNTTIRLAPGTYDLSASERYGDLPISTSCKWEQVYDGWELEIKADNLCFVADGDAEIVTQPRYANVLLFRDCENIRVQGLKLGHTPEQGLCAGGVIRLQGSANVEILDSDLYGCGILGILGEESRDVMVQNCVIHDCSQGAIYLRLCARFTMTDCTLTRIGTGELQSYATLFELTGCQDVHLLNLKVTDCAGGDLMFSDTNRAMTLEDSEFSGNAFHYFTHIIGEGLLIRNCTFDDAYSEGYFLGDGRPWNENGEILTEADIASMVHS